MKRFVLYNPLSCSGKGEGLAHKLDEILLGCEIIYVNLIEIKDYKTFFAQISEEDEVYICGGDGTLNSFVNFTADIPYKNKIYYFATGSGNDFLRDLGKDKGLSPFCINKYLQNLPVVTVGGKDYRFLNGVGFGVDGYCCQVAEDLREKNKKINYTAIVLKGFMFGYKPTSAKVTVDGKEFNYDRIWLAPTMKGRSYGGGLRLCPMQDRTAENQEVTFIAVHNAGKLSLLTKFPSIYKGTHVKFKNLVAIHKGQDITVEFERPSPFQIDGELIKDVKAYRVRTALAVENENREKEEATV